MELSELTPELRARYDEWCRRYRAAGIDLDADPPPAGVAYIAFPEDVVITDEERDRFLALAKERGWIA